MDANEVGQRLRRLRTAQGFGQIEFAERVGIANGSVSKLENGRMPLTDSIAEAIGEVLDCSPAFLMSATRIMPTTRPLLRAYADASQKAVDRQMADCSTALEIVDILGLRRIPDTIPVFNGDLLDDSAIEQFALDVRAAAQLDERDVVGNSIRAAERLGCVVLPMASELGRHLGLSVRADLSPVICVSRPSHDPTLHVPGDRQRFTVAHEIGHLALHTALGIPSSAEEATQVEKQAHLFAGAFLAPGDAMVEELRSLGGRVTLTTLGKIKERWGVSIKALVMRFRNLGVIDAETARSLYKQISARGWNKAEPVPVGNESAIWFEKALQRWAPQGRDSLLEAKDVSGIGLSYLRRWTEWGPTFGTIPEKQVVDIASRRAQKRSTENAPSR